MKCSEKKYTRQRKAKIMKTIKSQKTHGVSHNGVSHRRFLMFISTSLYALFGLILISLSIDFELDVLKLTENVKEVKEDWETVPFVKLVTVDDDECPEGTDLVMFKPWYGT